MTEIDRIRLREKCLTTALDRHAADDDAALELAGRLYDFLTGQHERIEFKVEPENIDLDTLVPSRDFKPIHKTPPARNGGQDEEAVPADPAASSSDPASDTVENLNKPHKPVPITRFAPRIDGDPAKVKGLAEDHPAAVEGRTLYPSTVADPGADGKDVLVSGMHNRNLGDRVVKGPWRGMPLYQLSLEERATCPRTCANWLTCYGNGMQMARRHRHGPELEAQIEAELETLSEKHPDGFVVRLHTLGDFYSPEYVTRWMEWIEEFPALRVFGYTAHPRDSKIGLLIAAANEHMDEWWCIRFSAAEPAPLGAVTIFRKPEGPVVEEGLVCPAKTGATANCGSCGLCWSPAMKGKTIVFPAHGRQLDEPQQGPKEPPAQKEPPEKDPADSAVDEVLDCIGALNDEGVKSNSGIIAARTHLPLARVRDILGNLVTEGKVEKTGHARGVNYTIPREPEPEPDPGSPEPHEGETQEAETQDDEPEQARDDEENEPDTSLAPKRSSGGFGQGPVPLAAARAKALDVVTIDGEYVLTDIEKDVLDLLAADGGWSKCDANMLANRLGKEPHDISWARRELVNKGYAERRGQVPDAEFRALKTSEGQPVGEG